MQDTTVLHIHVPDDVAMAIRASDTGRLTDEERIRVPLAIGLFARRAITLAKAASLAGMTRYEFASLLKETGLPAVEYRQADYEEDMAFIGSAVE